MLSVPLQGINFVGAYLRTSVLSLSLESIMSRLTGISLLSATNSKSFSSNSISRSQSATECFPGHGRCCYIHHLLLQGIRGDLQSRYFLDHLCGAGPSRPSMHAAQRTVVYSQVLCS